MNNPLPVARCSSLPRITECTASAESPGIIIDTGTEAARMGTAAHEFYARMVRENLKEPGDLFALAAQDNVAEDELRMLAWSGLREWKKVRDRIDVWNVEGEMGHVIRGEDADVFQLTGHPDLSGRLKDDPTTGVIIDWKTGYKEGVYLPQPKGYALLDLLIYGNPNHPRFREEREFVIPVRYLLMVVWTRLGITETFEVATTQIMDFREDLCRIFRSPIKQYAPAEKNCEYCPLAVECPARRTLLASACRDLQSMTGDDSTEITPVQLAALYPQSRMLKKAIDQYEKALKAAVVQAGETIPFEGGEIRLVGGVTRKIFWQPEVLAEFLSADQIAELQPTIGRTELDKAVAAGAPTGQKKIAKEQCLEALKAAGAVVEKPKVSIDYRKIS